MEYSRYAQGQKIRLGDDWGQIIAGVKATDGTAVFTTAQGQITVNVFKKRDPDVALDGVQVWLVEREEVAEPQYVALADDSFWGLRAGPTDWQSAPYNVDIVMGYELKGRVLANGVGIEGAGISLELRLETPEDDEITLWDSEEYNELVYLEEDDTWIAGPSVKTPIMTDAEGRWSFLVPSGAGAIYRRMADHQWGDWDDTDALSAMVLTHCFAWHKGLFVEVQEGTEAVITLDGATLVVHGTPGCVVRVGQMDDAGTAYTVPANGVVTLTNLHAGEVHIVQYHMNEWGGWDSEWGCPRMRVELEAGQTTEASLGAMTYYSFEDGIRAGRVYESPGVPASGVAIVVVDREECEIVDTVASTNGGGFWSVEMPEEGLGGDLFIHDATWGTVPILGNPYSDVVLGARAYSDWSDLFRPEQWRKGDYGHKHMGDLHRAVEIHRVSDDAVWQTEKSAYGGWITETALPKYLYATDIEQLVNEGTQIAEYNLVEGEEILEAAFTLSSQSFEEYETLPGLFRAMGHYPEAKLLHGGKIHGGVVLSAETPLDADANEVRRMGLEFGRLAPYVQVRSLGDDGQRVFAALSDMLCPYCGGPGWRDPGEGPAQRGFCVACAEVFEMPDATDCRGYVQLPTQGLDGIGKRHLRAIWQAGNQICSQQIHFHWRPDVYDETDAFVQDEDNGMRTNAPRWIALGLEDLADGKALGKFDGSLPTPYIAGHDLAYFGALTDVQRNLGLVQPRLIFPAGFVAQRDYTLRFGLRLTDNSEEILTVVVPMGTEGPSETNLSGDSILICQMVKLEAETMPAPYHGFGLCKAITGIEPVDESDYSGLRFTVVEDVPFLADTTGIVLKAKKSKPIALQLAQPTGSVDLTDDSFGQVMVAYCKGGDILTQRRQGLGGVWDGVARLGRTSSVGNPCVVKNRQGQVLLAHQKSTGQTELVVSEDDGRSERDRV